LIWWSGLGPEWIPLNDQRAAARFGGHFHNTRRKAVATRALVDPAATGLSTCSATASDLRPVRVEPLPLSALVVVTEAFPGNSFAVSLQHLREVNYYVNDGDGNVVALFRVYPLWKGTKDYGKELFLQSLMVRNGYRHLGIGNHLLEVVRVLAKRRKLLCQADDNVVRFYEKNHFEATPASTLVSDKHCTAWSQCSMGVPGTFRVTAPGTIGFSYTMQLMHWYITVAVYAPDDSRSLRTYFIILCVLTRVLSN
jgi:GNAT superfamily N-acetyltransferase